MKFYGTLALGLLALASVVYAQQPDEQTFMGWIKNNNIPAIVAFITENPFSRVLAPGISGPEGKNESKEVDLLSIYSRGDLDYSGERRAQRRYSKFDLIARYGSIEALIAALDARFERVKSKYSKGLERLLFPIQSYSSFSLDLNGVEDRGVISDRSDDTSRTGYVGKLLFNDIFQSNPLVIAATEGRLDMVKALVEWLKKKLEELNAKQLLPDYLNYPSANYDKKVTQFMFGTNALIETALIVKELLDHKVPNMAPINVYKEIAQYLLDQGAKPEGSARDTKGAFITPLYDTFFRDPTRLDVPKLLKDVGLTLGKRPMAKPQEEKQPEKASANKTLEDLINALKLPDLEMAILIIVEHPEFINQTYQDPQFGPITPKRYLESKMKK